jgi:excisionase family DNA binding protein
MNLIEQSEHLDKAEDLAKFFNVGKSSIYLLAKQGKIPCVRFGTHGVRFDRQAVLRALSRPAKSERGAR